MRWPWHWRRERADWPAAVRTYAAGGPRVPAARTPWPALKFVVMDAETSGFRAELDRMLSLSVVTVQGDRIHLREMRSWLIFQADAVVNPATLVHGILPSETAGGQREQEVLGELLPCLENAVLVGHHVSFDAGMINRALRRQFGIKLRNAAIDTAVMAARLLEAFHRTGYANQKPPSLEEVCAQLEIDMLERHTAAGDTFTTAQVFLQLAGLMRRRQKREIELRDLPRVSY